MSETKYPCRVYRLREMVINGKRHYEVSSEAFDGSGETLMPDGSAFIQSCATLEEAEAVAVKARDTFQDQFPRPNAYVETVGGKRL
jgi:hypothetical protein